MFLVTLMIIYTHLYSLLLHTSCVIYIWCITRSLDLTHLWCLALDLDPVGDAYHEAPVVGEYNWGQVDQVVEPEDGAPAQSV